MGSAAKRIVVAAHGHCFDGIVSAALFTHFRRRVSGETGIEFSYKSCGYGPNMQVVPERWLRGDENAIVDFRFTESDRLTWFFDHHPTAFANDAQRDRALAGSKRYFYDPEYGSCSKLVADVGRERFGVSFEPFSELISWADTIDRAAFASAEEAVDRTPPMKQLAAVVEQKGDGERYNQLIPRLLAEPADDVARSEDVQALFRPIRDAQAETRKRIADRLERRGDCVVVDLHEQRLRASGKFYAYAIAPDCLYSVALLRTKQHFKISVGYNPWCGRPRRHDIAEICRRYGGGGHAVVGAVSFPLDKLAEAREVTTTVVDELNAEPGQHG